MLIPSSLHLAATGQGSPSLLILLGILALLMVYLLIALIEGVALTFLNWNPFRPSLITSIIMNIISGVINGILLVLLQHTPLTWIPISFGISLLIDIFVLSYFKRGALSKNILFAILINLASYLLLILPAYYFGTHPS